MKTRHRAIPLIEAALIAEERGSSEHRSVLICPECGGPIWEFHEGDQIQFRCYTGHEFSAEEFYSLKNKEVEKSLQVAFRALQENAILARRLASHSEHRQGHSAIAKVFRSEAYRSARRAGILRDRVLHQRALLPEALIDIARRKVHASRSLSSNPGRKTTRGHRGA